MRRGVVLVLCGAWLSAALGGAAWLTRYKSTAAPIGPEASPLSSGLLATDRPTLVMTVHPHCPCTKASFTELEKFLTQHAGRVATVLLFVQSEGEDARFIEGALWARAETWPGVRRVVDVNGAESKRLGAAASGTTLLYAPDGKLLFRGGMTVARGHEGDSPGAERMAALLSGRPALPTAPVFGCGLEAQECS